MTANQEQTRTPDLYGSIVDNLEHMADHAPVTDYALALAGIRAQVAIANELAGIRASLDLSTKSLADRADTLSAIARSLR